MKKYEFNYLITIILKKLFFCFFVLLNENACKILDSTSSSLVQYQM